ncbi:MAG: glycosyltransferase family 4 protein [Caldilineaceae bacterium]|nr:glycosyltransferase family 4 protein [Caldilineaceae bacterium]
MHILFVTGEYPPMRGGVGAYTAELGRALLPLGVKVSVITALGMNPTLGMNPQATINPALGMNPQAKADSSIYPQSYPQIRHWGWSTVGEIARFARQQGADWLHVQYQTAAFQMHPAINFAPYLWRRWGLHTAWTYHDLLVPYLFPKAGRFLRRWITERPAFDATFTTVTNEADFRQLAGRVDRLFKIPIGSNIEGRTLSSDQRQKRRRQRGYTDDSLVIGYFGFLNRSKGGLTLVNTLDLLVRAGRNAYLLMIGERVGASDPTNYGYLQEVEGRIAALGLADRVQWTGHQSDAEIGVDLNAADILFMPYVDGVSLRRGTLMAGLVNGCAIVTTAPRDPLPELVDGRELLTVPPEDATAGAAAILRIADDPALAQRLRSNARHASGQFAWSTIAAQHQHLYTRFADI